MYSHRTNIFLPRAHMERGRPSLFLPPCTYGGRKALCCTLIFLLKIHSLCDMSVMDTICHCSIYVCVCVHVCAYMCVLACKCVYIVTQSPRCRALSHNWPERRMDTNAITALSRKYLGNQLFSLVLNLATFYIINYGMLPKATSECWQTETNMALWAVPQF